MKPNIHSNFVLSKHAAGLTAQHNQLYLATGIGKHTENEKFPVVRETAGRTTLEGYDLVGSIIEARTNRPVAYFHAPAPNANLRAKKG
jgi:hypothetical protein